MLQTQDAPITERRVEPLDEIEDLLARARAGELESDAALSRIAAIARHAPTDGIYQKPWG